MSRKWVVVHEFFDILEAQRLEAVLRENNLPVNVIFRGDSVFSGVFKPALGEGVIMVREDCAEEARKVIEEFNKGANP